MAQKLKYSAKFKRNYVALFAIAFFCVMLLAELLLALSIPVFVQRQDSYSREIKKREMLLLFDDAQNTCRSISEKDEIIKQEKMLLADTLSVLAGYLREESSRLTPEDVDRLTPHVQYLHKVATQLKEGKCFSRENKLDSSKYIESVIKK